MSAAVCWLLPLASAVNVAANGTFAFTVHSNITYAQGIVGSPWGSGTSAGPAGIKNLSLDYYDPHTTNAGPRPAMIVIHGGAYWTGDKTDAVIVETCSYYASAGWATFCVNYRLTGDSGNVPADWPSAFKDNMTWIPKYIYPAVRDAKAAVRFVRAKADQLRIDQTKITAFGESAGAVTAVALALTFEADYKDEISAAEDPTLTSTHLSESSSVATVLDHWGSDDGARQLSMRDGRKRYRDSNPPLAIFHGTADTLVPFINALQLDAQYNMTGVAHTLFPLQGAGHGCWNAKTASGQDQWFAAYNFVVKAQNLTVVGSAA